MYQGQLCKIQVHENQDPAFSEMLGENGGWFLKLKGSDGKTKFHLVDQNRSREMTIDPGAVDESLLNHNSTKPFYVTCVVPSNIQPLVMNVVPNIDEETAKACIQAEIAATMTARDISERGIEIKKKKIEQEEEHLKEYDKRADELRKISAMSKPHFMYAYGKHSIDGSEFCWRVPFELYGKIRVGLTAIAETKLGAQPIIVTRIEKSSYLQGHKLIISVA